MSKKQVYIFENSGSPHETAMLSAKVLFEESGFEVLFVVNSKSKSALQSFDPGKSFNIPFVIDSFKDKLRFLWSGKKENIVFYNTVSARNCLFVAICSLFFSKNVFYIRNANSWFVRNSDTEGFLRSFVSTATYVLKRLVLRPRAHAYAVGSFNVAAYVKKNFSDHVAVVPFSMRDDEVSSVPEQSHQGIVTLVIPGTIDLARKDLTIIRDAFLSLPSEKLEKVHLILLGRPVSENDLSFVSGWAEKTPRNLTFYKSFIPTEEFISVMKSATCILSSLNIEYHSKYYSEIYGLSKDTGVEAHAIGYAKPLIVNSGYNTDAFLAGSTIHFKNSEDCAAIILKLVEDRDWRVHLQQIAITDSANYRIRSLLPQFKSNLKI
jgi:hypothetical protein